MTRALLLLAALLGAEASASQTTAQCAAHAAQTFAIPRAVLAAVWVQEGGRVGGCSSNTNGTRDCGPMQINTLHLDAFGVTEDDLRDDPCTNFAIAAVLLRRHFVATGSWAEAMTRYHSRTPAHATRYLARLKVSVARVQRLCAGDSSACE